MFLQLLVRVMGTVPGIEVRATAKTVAEGIKAVREDSFDLLVLDLKLPDGDGLDVFRVAVDAHPDIECIVLSSATREFNCPQCLFDNLRALVDKTQAFDQLQAALTALARARGVEMPLAAVAPEALARLRPREMEVFRLIGQGLTTADIGRQLGITTNTIETHRKSIAAKLDAKGAELVRLATIHNQTSLPE